MEPTYFFLDVILLGWVFPFLLKLFFFEIISKIISGVSLEWSIFFGKETKKIVPTSLGITVNDFLLKNFPELMDYNFTAKMEQELDDIANGKKIWYKVISKFYDKLKPIVDKISVQKSLMASSKVISLSLIFLGNEYFSPS